MICMAAFADNLDVDEDFKHDIIGNAMIAMISVIFLVNIALMIHDIVLKIIRLVKSIRKKQEAIQDKNENPPKVCSLENNPIIPEPRYNQLLPIQNAFEHKKRSKKINAYEAIIGKRTKLKKISIGAGLKPSLSNLVAGNVPNIPHLKRRMKSNLIENQNLNSSQILLDSKNKLKMTEEHSDNQNLLPIKSNALKLKDSLLIDQTSAIFSPISLTKLQFIKCASINERQTQTQTLKIISKRAKAKHATTLFPSSSTMKLQKILKNTGQPTLINDVQLHATSIIDHQVKPTTTNDIEHRSSEIEDDMRDDDISN
jgi:hypothetical protein